MSDINYRYCNHIYILAMGLVLVVVIASAITEVDAHNPEWRKRSVEDFDMQFQE